MKSWKIEESDFRTNSQLNETLYSIANGYIGVRGSHEEGTQLPSVRGTYINGFYESEKITYGEKLFGFPDNSQSILNVIDGQTLLIRLSDGETFNLFDGEILDYHRELNFKTGQQVRTIKWKSKSEHTFDLVFRRMALFTQREIYVCSLEVQSQTYRGTIFFDSVLDGDVSNIVSADDPRVGSSHAKALCVDKIWGDKYSNNYVKVSTKNSNLSVVAGMFNDLSADCQRQVYSEDQKVKETLSCNYVGGVIKFVKYVCYTDTRRHNLEDNEAQTILKELPKDFDLLAKQQEKYLSDYWNNSSIIIEGDEAMQQGIRFNLFHLLQSVGKDDQSNISAKGLSGEGYEGHYFWDTEIYIFPFFLFTNPELAKGLIDYRHRILPAARKRAREMGHSIGALYPWRTIAGDECSPFFPAGTAQYHINADVAYSLIQYFKVTENEAYMAEKGLEVLVEIARLMHHIGHYNRKGQFCIDAVTGPDEYTCIVNNNYYTNCLTKKLLTETVAIWHRLKTNFSNELDNLKNKIGLNEGELVEFKNAADAMLLVYDEDLNIRPQDDSFLNKKLWDFENTPKENYPLLLHYHPLTLYRHQVCKQADVVLAHFLAEEYTDFTTIKNDYNYYEKVTTHDSSLSTCIFSIMANRVGEHEKAYNYFMNTARLDIDNLHHNTKDGIHTACMGGSWMAIVFGFAGMRIIGEQLQFHPYLPTNWTKLAFKIQYKERVIVITMSQEGFDAKIISGNPLSIVVDGVEKSI